MVPILVYKPRDGVGDLQHDESGSINGCCPVSGRELTGPEKWRTLKDDEDVRVSKL